MIDWRQKAVASWRRHIWRRQWLRRVYFVDCNCGAVRTSKNAHHWACGVNRP